MKNTFGTSVTVTLFGESHGSAIGAVLDGMAPGVAVDEQEIVARMALRHGLPEISTPRREADRVEILSGVMQGKTTGTPLAVLIRNEDARPADYPADLPYRPGHADFAAEAKYHGFADQRGGGHFSGRLSAPLVALGTVAAAALRTRGITIGAHVQSCGGVKDRPFAADPHADFAALATLPLAVLDAAAGEDMRRAALRAKEEGDSLGGVIEAAVLGLPCGVGEPWFDTVEGVLAHALFSIPAVKGVEFGDGFSLADCRGSEANDAYGVKDGIPFPLTNHAGGVLGGLTGGAPLLCRVAVKPTPSIAKPQRTVTRAGEPTTLSLGGRHDPAVVLRARVVVEAMLALSLCDLLAQRYGTDWLGGR